MTKVQKYKDEISKSPEKLEASAKSVATNGRTVSSDPGTPGGGGSSSEGVNFLSSLLHATIFFDYFEYIAHKTYSGGKLEAKVLKLKTVHPRMHDICLFLDVFIRFVAVSALIALAGYSAYKVVLK